MIELERIDNKVYFEGRELTIVPQATKGPNQEVVKIEGLPGSNGQKYIRLMKVQQGIHEYETQGRAVTTSGYRLTEDEQARINELQAEIDAIKAAAKARFVAKPSLDVDPSKMTYEQRMAKIAELQRYYGI